MAVNGINLYGTATDTLASPSLAAWAQYVAKSSAAISAKTAGYTISDLDHVVTCNGTFTVSLPPVAEVVGREFIVRNISSGTITIARNSTETIDGVSANPQLTGHGIMTVVSDGSNWLVTTGFCTDAIGRSFVWDSRTAKFVQIVRGTQTIETMASVSNFFYSMYYS